jgi:hypothetical protein
VGGVLVYVGAFRGRIAVTGVSTVNSACQTVNFLITIDRGTGAIFRFLQRRTFREWGTSTFNYAFNWARNIVYFYTDEDSLTKFLIFSIFS